MTSTLNAKFVSIKDYYSIYAQEELIGVASAEIEEQRILEFSPNAMAVVLSFGSQPNTCWIEHNVYWDFYGPKEDAEEEKQEVLDQFVAYYLMGILAPKPAGGVNQD